MQSYVFSRATVIISYVTTMFECIERRKADVLRIIRKETVAITVYTVIRLLWQRWELMKMIIHVTRSRIILIDPIETLSFPVLSKFILLTNVIFVARKKR